MKRFFIIPILLFACIAFAQTPGPESNNSNRNQPAGNVPHTTAPATAQRQGAPTPATSEPAQQPEPTTVMVPQNASPASADPMLEPAELPKKPLSLIGGVATKVDPIRNRVQVRPFGGGGKITVRFDERSHVYRDGRETTVLGIHPGDRVYLDTMLLDGHVFAKNLRVMTTTQAAEARGQLTGNPSKNEFTMIDDLTGQTVRFEVTPRTALQLRGETTTIADLRPGAIVDVSFLPGQKAGTARQVLVLAVPGESFIFAGKVTNVDMSTGTISIDNQTDDRNYTIHFDPATVADREHLTVGREITARATFDGRNYHASSVTVIGQTSAEK